jgi:putative membrane protein
MPIAPQAAPSPHTSFALWTLTALYVAARIWTIAFGATPPLAAIAALILVPVAFALVHGALVYGRSGAFAFVLICLVIGNIFENLSVATGFPFGHYYFTDAMGPNLFHIPILIGLAYVGMGYLCWTLTRLILGGAGQRLTGSQVFTVPAAAAFLMVAWDFSQDPVWSTVGHTWIWRDGGAFFGVPATNFFGWYLVLWVVYQAFALYLRGRDTHSSALPAGYWHAALVFYLLVAVSSMLPGLASFGPATVTDQSGVVWRVDAVTRSCALAAVFGMLPFLVLAWVRLRESEE